MLVKDEHVAKLDKMLGWVNSSDMSTYAATCCHIDMRISIQLNDYLWGGGVHSKTLFLRPKQNTADHIYVRYITYLTQLARST